MAAIRRLQADAKPVTVENIEKEEEEPYSVASKPERKLTGSFLDIPGVGALADPERDPGRYGK